MQIREQFRHLSQWRLWLIRLCLNPLQIMGKEGNGKVLLCPDARENLGFSVQTNVASLQKILFKGF